MRQASCVVVVDKNSGYVLSISRKDNANDLGLPGGKLDEGETPEHACVREVEEETGLLVKDLVLLYQGVCLSPQGEPFWTYCFLALRHSNELVQKEGEGIIQWVPWTRLLHTSMTFAEYNSQVYSQYRKYKEEQIQSYWTQASIEWRQAKEMASYGKRGMSRMHDNIARTLRELLNAWRY